MKLTVHCKNMPSPKLQRPKFDQTLEAGFWQLATHTDAQKHDNQTVSTTTDWTREYKAGKKPQQILKSTRNLLLRACEYADVLDMRAEITIGDNPPETISHYTAQPSDYFKTKTYR
ncbi:MAG: hypothetical protein ABIK68_02355 [bacterium]